MAAGDWIAYVGARLVLGAVGALPFSAGLSFGRLLARCQYRLDRRHRAIADVNLEIAFPGLSLSERRRLALGGWENMGEQAVHLLHFPRLRERERMARLVRYDNLEPYREVKAEGRPVIILTAHLGGWELLAFSHSVLQHPLHFIYRPLGEPRMDAWLLGRRSLSGNTPVPKREALRPLLRALARGEDVGILADQNVQPQDGLFVDFFGRKACMTAAPAALAVRTGAVVIPAFLVPDPEGRTRYVIHADPAVPVARSGNFDADVQENTARFAAVIESAVRRWPDRWLWGHRRWKTRPPDDPADLYARI